MKRRALSAAIVITVLGSLAPPYRSFTVHRIDARREKPSHIAGGKPKLTLVDPTSGLRLEVMEQKAPMLRILLPQQSCADRGVEVIFPEHVTARQHGHTDPEHLYLFSKPPASKPNWQRVGNSLQYEMDLPPGVHLLARATLHSDGVRFDYYFTNHSILDYDRLQAVTDPRMQSVFHDVWLERTYVHHQGGFDLLASEIPERLTMPKSKWLPARYMVSYLWQVMPLRVEKREDGITYYDKSRRVDEPFIATLSVDGSWVAATFSSRCGNVWSNPELTCQHADPEGSLKAGGTAHLAVKMLILRGTLNDVLTRVRKQRKDLK